MMQRCNGVAIVVLIAWAAGCGSSASPPTPAVPQPVPVVTDAPAPSAAPGPPCDPKNMTECKDKCAKGDDRSCFSAAKLLQTGAPVGGPEEKEYLAVFQKTCDAQGPDTAEACGRLAYVMFMSPTAKNVLRSIEYGKKGCDLGSSLACRFLGKEDVDSGLPARAKNYERACRLGDQDSCVQAGLMALDGRAGAKDTAKGLALLDDACNAGEPTACADLYFLYDRGSVKGGAPTEVKPDAAKFDAYKTKYCALKAKGHGITCP